jgi:hypothetical protein
VKRSGWIKRRVRLAPGGKPRPRKRSSGEFARIYGSKARVAWVKRQPCIAPFCSLWQLAGCENAHIETGGMGRKADADKIVPACRRHHALMHSEGVAWFAFNYALDLPALAMETDKSWRAYQERR